MQNEPHDTRFELETELIIYLESKIFNSNLKATIDGNDQNDNMSIKKKKQIQIETTHAVYRKAALSVDPQNCFDQLCHLTNSNNQTILHKFKKQKKNENTMNLSNIVHRFCVQ